MKNINEVLNSTVVYDRLYHGGGWQTAAITQTGPSGVRDGPGHVLGQDYRPPVQGDHAQTTV